MPELPDVEVFKRSVEKPALRNPVNRTVVHRVSHMPEKSRAFRFPQMTGPVS
jgi:formamidopyrimidine-DNA glycosylase